jgi:hypothetical protein
MVLEEKEVEEVKILGDNIKKNLYLILINVV